MAAIGDIVHQTSTSTGTGNLTLAAVNGKRDFGTVFGTGATPNVFHYFIGNRSAAEWERGTGSMSDATTLVRDTVIASSNSNSAVNFSAGTKDVVNDLPAGNQLDKSTVSANGLSLITAADYAAMRALLDLEAGTDFLAPAAIAAAYAIVGRSVVSGAGLTGGGDLSADRTLAVGAGTGIVVNSDDVAVDKASDADVRTAASNKVVTTDLIESASALVALTDAAPVAVDWDAFINGELTVTTNRQIANPTNGQPGTWRTITVQGNDGTDRTITFGNQFLGSVPTITDCDSGIWYLLTLFCVTASHFHVSSTKVKG